MAAVTALRWVYKSAIETTEENSKLDNLHIAYTSNVAVH